MQYEINTCFFSTVTCGLETVLAEENEKLGVEIRGMKFELGKAVYKAFGEVNRLMNLRGADNICCLVTEFI